MMHNNNAAQNPLISFVISTYNRREVLLQTLRQLHRCGLAAGEFEILVVDNASTDGSADAVAFDWPGVRVFAEPVNRGSCAKNVAIAQAAGDYIVFLDDDSFPEPDSVCRMIERFEADPLLGAAVFTITLPDGSRECSAYPDVFIGCGTGFRREALLEVGLLPDDFFMQAEEYDLSLRLLDAGWDIRSFDDLYVTHLKTPCARQSWRTMRLDVRNNLIVATRYIPDGWMRHFTMDWMQRYWHIAASKGMRSAFVAGAAQGLLQALRPGHRRPVGEPVFRRFARIDQIEWQMNQAVERLGIKSVLFADYGKNIYPYWLAAHRAGVAVVAIADDRLAGCVYRNIPVVNDSVARRLRYDAVIISNSSHVHALRRTETWGRLDERPVIDLLRVLPPLRKQTGLAA